MPCRERPFNLIEPTAKLSPACLRVGGIGFTMSLFIANLAFEGTALLDSAKLGILSGSLVSGLVAAAMLRVGGTAKSSAKE